VISVFHQLHCHVCQNQLFLDLLEDWLDYFLSIKESLTEALRIRHNDSEATGTYFNMSHVEHCLDYIHQSIICAGDTTLETVTIENDMPILSVNGWGDVHQCRDWRAIYDFAAANNIHVVERGSTV
jgi:hypothetical protein